MSKADDDNEAALDRLQAMNDELRERLARTRARLAGEPSPEERRAAFQVIDGGRS